MLPIFDALRSITFASILTKLLVSTLCGTIIGLERSSKNRTAGFRTHILVCLAGCLAAITGLYLYLGVGMPADVTRISGQIITGLGFIGAGSIIITKRMTIKGLTTAAGLWTTGIIGVAVGSGFYEGGLLGAALVLLAETYFVNIRGMIQKAPQYSFKVFYDHKDALDHVLRYCKDRHMSIVNLKIRSSADLKQGKYAALIMVRGTLPPTELCSHIQHMPGIIAVEYA